MLARVLRNLLALLVIVAQVVTPAAVSSPTTASAQTVSSGQPISPHSLELNGATAYAEAPDIPQLNPAGDWSIELWFRDTNANGFNHPPAFAVIKGDTGHDAEAPYLLGVRSGQLFAGTRTAGVAHEATVDLVASGADPADWHHIAATYDAHAEVVQVYLDARLVARQADVPRSVTGTHLPLSIGRDGASGSPWMGMLRDLRVWNVVRSEADIRSDAQIHVNSLQPGLVANWTFDDGAGVVAAERSGHAQAARLNGGAQFTSDVPPPGFADLNVTFDQLPPGMQLRGTYPANVVDWGSVGWVVDSPHAPAMDANNLTLPGAGPVHTSVNLLVPRMLSQVDIFNAGADPNRVSLRCDISDTREVLLDPQESQTVVTGWDHPCTTIAVEADHGHDIHLRNFHFREPPPEGPACQLYPIGLSAMLVDGVAQGTVLPTIRSGFQPGEFDWLSWTGRQDEHALVRSLTPPGDSFTYTNPLDRDDHILSAGDWVRGRPHVFNGDPDSLQEALQHLETVVITVPVWDRTRRSDDDDGRQKSDDDQGDGGTLFHVSGFARIRLSSFAFNRADTINARFLGMATCPPASSSPT
ncbi:MAG: LamG domain-containing protein, partial [Chloroflexi bacterium]|nr:LamG domain-containing protein [Chloroflexota bacterium]